MSLLILIFAVASAALAVLIGTLTISENFNTGPDELSRRVRLSCFIYAAPAVVFVFVLASSVSGEIALAVGLGASAFYPTLWLAREYYKKDAVRQLRIANAISEFGAHLITWLGSETDRFFSESDVVAYRTRAAANNVSEEVLDALENDMQRYGRNISKDAEHPCYVMGIDQITAAGPVARQKYGPWVALTSKE